MIAIFYFKIDIFDSDLVWRIQLMIILNLKIRVMFVGKCLLIEFVTSNLSRIYFCIPEIIHLLNLCSRAVNSPRLLCKS